MKRRHFLSIFGCGAGSVLVPTGIARRIHDVCIGASEPLILAPDDAHTFLYAEECLGTYTFHLGDPRDEIETPSVEEFIEMRGYSRCDDESLLAFLTEWRCLDEEEIDEEDERAVKKRDRLRAKALKSLRAELNTPIEGSELNDWLEWEYSTNEGTMPQAYRYLSELDLRNSDESGTGLGRLSFVEGDRPGSNLTYCTTDGLAGVAALQHRLNELRTGAAIELL